MNKSESWQILRGDALQSLQQMPDEVVDVVAADPPYSSGGLHIGGKRATPSQKYTSEGDWGRREFEEFDGDNCDQMSWIWLARAWMLECHRVAKQGAHLYVFADWRQLSAATVALQAACWQLRGILVWNKGELARAPYPGSWRHGGEFVAWGSKGYPWTCTGGAWQKGVAPVHNVLPHPPPKKKVHPTEKPVALYMDILRTSSPQGGLILDPFCGSGNSGLAALRLGMRYLGVDKSRHWAKKAAESLCAELGGAPPGAGRQLGFAIG